MSNTVSYAIDIYKWMTIRKHSSFFAWVFDELLSLRPVVFSPAAGARVCDYIEWDECKSAIAGEFAMHSKIETGYGLGLYTQKHKATQQILMCLFFYVSQIFC